MIDVMLSVLPALVLASQVELYYYLGLGVTTIIFGGMTGAISAGYEHTVGMILGVNMFIVGIIIVVLVATWSVTEVENTTIVIDGKDVIPDTAGPEVIYDEYGIRILLEREEPGLEVIHRGDGVIILKEASGDD
ncbi:MAG: hypothetical protein MPK62_00945 [Alphaproteobacteria bacterium]|nr:hypothetical protein [Alphaproteobacteria bacterium]MDA8029701.1 hypothetical protein [Alphaproteobacteria bacterium]